MGQLVVLQMHARSLNLRIQSSSWRGRLLEALLAGQRGRRPRPAAGDDRPAARDQEDRRHVLRHPAGHARQAPPDDQGRQQRGAPAVQGLSNQDITLIH